MREYMDELHIYSEVEVGTKVVMVKQIPARKPGERYDRATIEGRTRTLIGLAQAGDMEARSQLV